MRRACFSVSALLLCCCAAGPRPVETGAADLETTADQAGTEAEIQHRNDYLARLRARFAAQEAQVLPSPQEVQDVPPDAAAQTAPAASVEVPVSPPPATAPRPAASPVTRPDDGARILTASVPVQVPASDDLSMLVDAVYPPATPPVPGSRPALPAVQAVAPAPQPVPAAATEAEQRRHLVAVLEARLARGDADPDLRRRLALEYMNLNLPLEARRVLGGLGDQDVLAQLTVTAGHFYLGEEDDALRALDALHRRLKDQAPLRFLETRFCSRVRGYGLVDEIASSFKPGGWFVLYAPMDGYACRQEGERWHTSMEIGASIVNADGVPVWERRRFDDFELETVSWLPAFHLSLLFQVPPFLGAGTYRLRVTVHDRVKDQEARTEVEFQIR